MPDKAKRRDVVIVLALLLAGALFLLRLAYLPIWVSTPIGLVLLIGAWSFLYYRVGVRAPATLFLLLLAAIEVDAFGNLLGLYNQRFRYVQYDEFSHCLISALVLPVVIWLMRAGLARRGLRIPTGFIAFFAFTAVFTLAGLYEVIELWDDKYFHPEPGWRIHGSYDTANDLQWDILGMGTGALIGYLVLRSREMRATDKSK